MIRTARWKIFRLIFGFVLCLLPFISFGQKDHLNKKISLEIKNQKLEIVLAEIENKGGFGLSYNAELINQDSLISLKANNKKVSEILNSIFPENSFGYKSIGRHVVLYSKIPKQSPALKIKGFIVDARSGEKIKNATIYEPENNLTASSNVDGYYEITVKGSKDQIGLSYSKFGYRDSIVFIKEKNSTRSNIYLIPLAQKPSTLNPKEVDPQIQDITERKLVQWIVPEEQLNSSKNLQLFENKKAQISLLPLVGTNGPLSGNISNNLSFNLFSGYSKGLNGIEVGGFLNIIKEDVFGTQIAGFGNITGNKTDGAQIAGFFNHNGGNLKGAQIAGFSNSLLGDVNGIQIAGFANTLKGKMNGIQAAGFSNLTTADVDGIQAAGFSNVAFGDVKFAQISGFSNYGNNVEGVQAAGFLNVAFGNVGFIQAAGFANIAKGNSTFQVSGFSNITLKSSDFQGTGFANLAFKNTKFQVAGFSNITFGKVEGLQVSGFFNYAQNLNGIQLSFINACEEVEGGTPIGFLSFVKSGVHSFEYSYEEFFPINFSFRTGVPLFYNILKIGRSSENQHFTYGIGSRLLNRKKWDFNLEGYYSSVFSNNINSVSFQGQIVKIQGLASIKLFNSLRINAGPSLNLGIVNTNLNETQTSLYDGAWFKGELSTTNNFEAWMGFHIGLQIL